MLVARIDGAQAVIGKEQGYQGLPVRVSDVDGDRCLVTAWEPTPAELARLNAGAKIHVSLLFCIKHPPIFVEVGPQPVGSEGDKP